MERLIILLVISATIFCEKITLALDWTVNQNHAGIFVALDKGYYKDMDIELEIVGSGIFSPEKSVDSKKVDFGISFMDDLIFSNLNGFNNIVSIAKINYRTDGFLSLETKDILMPKDFEGKTYGSYGGAQEMAQLKYIMQSNNADFSKLKIVNMFQPNILKSFSSGIDFIWAFYFTDAIFLNKQGIKYNFISLQNYLPKSYSAVIIANKNEIGKKSNLYKKFLKATSMGYSFAMSNPKETANILTKYNTSLDLQIAIDGQIYLSKYYIDSTDKYWGHQNKEIYDKYIDFLFKNKMINRKIDSLSIFTDSLLDG